jgi:hypothetical protein
VLAAETCNNNIDDDADGLVDCFDTGCDNNANCCTFPFTTWYIEQTGTWKAGADYGGNGISYSGCDECEWSFDSWFDNITLVYHELSGSSYIVSSNVFAQYTDCNDDNDWISIDNQIIGPNPFSGANCLQINETGNYIITLIGNTTSDTTCYRNLNVTVTEYDAMPNLVASYQIVNTIPLNKSTSLNLTLSNTGNADAYIGSLRIYSSNLELLNFDNTTSNSWVVPVGGSIIINYTFNATSSGDIRINWDIGYGSSFESQGLSLSETSNPLVHINYAPQLFNYTIFNDINFKYVGDVLINLTRNNIPLNRGYGFYYDTDEYDSCDKVQFTFTSPEPKVSLTYTNSTCILLVSLTSYFNGKTNLTINVTDTYNNSASILLNIYSKNGNPELCDGIDNNDNGLIDTDYDSVSCCNSSWGCSSQGLTTCNNLAISCVNYSYYVFPDLAGCWVTETFYNSTHTGFNGPLSSDNCPALVDYTLVPFYGVDFVLGGDYQFLREINYDYNVPPPIITRVTAPPSSVINSTINYNVTCRSIIANVSPSPIPINVSINVTSPDGDNLTLQSTISSDTPSVYISELTVDTLGDYVLTSACCESEYLNISLDNINLVTTVTGGSTDAGPSSKSTINISKQSSLNESNSSSLAISKYFKDGLSTTILIVMCLVIVPALINYKKYMLIIIVGILYLLSQINTDYLSASYLKSKVLSIGANIIPSQPLLGIGVMCLGGYFIFKILRVGTFK